MKRIILFGSLFLLVNMPAQQSYKDYFIDDVKEFINPKISEINLYSGALDLLVVGAGAIVADQIESQDSFSMAKSIVVVMAAIACNEYFRTKYTKKKLSFSKNLLYLLAYVMHRNGIM